MILLLWRRGIFRVLRTGAVDREISNVTVEIPFNAATRFAAPKRNTVCPPPIKTEINKKKKNGLTIFEIHALYYTIRLILLFRRV